MAILITSALSAEAHKLKSQLVGRDITLGDYADVPEVMIKSGQMTKLPSPAGTSYQHQMLALCLDKGVEAIYALQPAEFTALEEAAQLFSEYGIDIKSNQP